MLNNPDDKSNKSFWRFIKSKRQDSVTISSLKKGRKVIFDSKEKANTFNEQFHSEDTANLPTMDGVFPAINQITISPEGMLKLLRSLDTKKATGPTRFLHAS